MSISIGTETRSVTISPAEKPLQRLQREILAAVPSQDVEVFSYKLYVDLSGVHGHYMHLDLLNHMHADVQNPHIPTTEEISGKYYVTSHLDSVDTLPEGIKGVFFHLQPSTRRMQGLTKEIIGKLKERGIQFVGTSSGSIGTREIHHQLAPIMPMENAQLEDIQDGLYMFEVECGEPIHDAIPLLSARLTPLS